MQDFTLRPPARSVSWAALFGLVLLFAPVAQSLASDAPVAATQTVQTRIVGGTQVPDNRYPFMAAIFFESAVSGRFVPQCGGSLIAPRWVVTAAHCVVDGNTGEVTQSDSVAVRTGSLSVLQGGDFQVVSNVIVHPAYNRFTSQNDIALLQLSTPVNTPVIALPEPTSDVPTVGESAIAAGWGATAENGLSSTDLLEVTLPITAHADCLAVYPDTLVQTLNVCAGGTPQGGEDSCQGDSGGPLFVPRDGVWVLAGVVSYGIGCARPNIPGVYTRATSYTNWIRGFVPNVALAGTPGTSTLPEPSNDPTTPPDTVSQFPLLDANTPTASGTIEQGMLFVYEVTGSRRVELTTVSGDADLFITQGPVIAENAVICSSVNTTRLDACDLPNTTDALFAVVVGFVDSEYRIDIITDQPANDAPTGGSSGGGGGWHPASMTLLLLVLIRRRRIRVSRG